MPLLPKSKQSKFSSFHLLVPILARYKGHIVLAVIALLAASASTLILPIIVRFIVDAGVASDLALMQQGFIYLLFCALFIGLATACRFYMVSWLGERVVSDLRKQLFSHLLVLPNAFYDQNQTGELTSRLTTDTTLVEQVVGTSVSMALRSALLFLGAFAMLLFTSIKLTLLVTLVTPVVVVPLIMFSRKYRAFSKESQSYVAQSSAFASQVLGLIDTTKSYQYEPYARSYFNEVVEDGFLVSKRRIFARSCLTVVIIVMVISAMVAVMWYGALEVMGPSSSISSGQLGQFFVYAVFVATAVGSLSEVWGELMRASGALQRIIQILSETTQVDQGEKVPQSYEVDFDAVSFAYPNRENFLVLNKVSFKGKVGSVSALVGVSGAGKSTIFKLLMRYYQAHSGEIKIGGIPIGDIELQALRDSISLVSHEAGIFPTSVKDNICMGREYTDEQIEHAARQANISEFVNNLPDGYDSLLGEKGVLLSEGQRQRISLARAIIRDAPIILLDEATNALDAITEEAITNAMTQVFANKTVFVIAHRLATVVNADQILVIEHGEIENKGTHKELCKKSELYSKLASIQLLT